MALIQVSKASQSWILGDRLEIELLWGIEFFVEFQVFQDKEVICLQEHVFLFLQSFLHILDPGKLTHFGLPLFFPELLIVLVGLLQTVLEYQRVFVNDVLRDGEDQL